MVSIVKLLTLGIAGATAIIFLRDAATKGLGVAAAETGAGFGGLGGGIGATFSSLGQGLQQFGSGVGTGVAKLFDPLFTLRDLIYGPQAGQQAAPTAATQGQIPQEQPVTQRQPQKQLPINNLMNVGSLDISDGIATISNVFGTLRGPAYGGFSSQQAQAQALTSGIIAGAKNPATAAYFDTPFYRSLGV